MKVLVLGANGMFGSMVATVLAQYADYNVTQTVRANVPRHGGMADTMTVTLDVLDTLALEGCLANVAPDVVINCTGLIKQRPEASDILQIYPINALFPHQLARFCGVQGIRLVQFSTDCIFSGQDGNYADDAISDVQDYYGQSKCLGEVSDQSHVVTLRTSIIGHEAQSSYQLIDWFLEQEGSVRGFSKAIFSGFPTVEIGRVLAEYVLPQTDLSGTYNLSADPISKLELLRIVRDVYGKNIEIVPDYQVQIDRSLNSSALRARLGYTPPPWPDLIAALKATRPQF